MPVKKCSIAELDECARRTAEILEEVKNETPDERILSLAESRALDEHALDCVEEGPYFNESLAGITSDSIPDYDQLDTDVKDA